MSQIEDAKVAIPLFTYPLNAFDINVNLSALMPFYWDGGCSSHTHGR